MKIKDIPLENRPRERAKKQGMESLSNAELLALILGKGNKEENVVEMANRLLSLLPIDKLSQSSLREIQGVKGIGEAKAMQILASFALGRRTQNKNLKKITCPKDVFDHFKSEMSHLEKEQFRILLLDGRKRILKEEIISLGTVNASLIHPRDIFRSAIKENAESIILIHNHPSGNSKPSEKDKHITVWLKEVGSIIGIPVIDHVIIGKTTFHSFS